MPKEDVNESVLGMLSTAGSNTRPVRPVIEEPGEVEPPAPAPVEEHLAAQEPAAEPAAEAAPEPQPEAKPAPEAEAPKQRLVPPTELPSAHPPAPRTLRLRPSTAQALRDAWLEAKRDDVLLTAQDFASDLLEDMLKRRRRQTRAAG